MRERARHRIVDPLLDEEEVGPVFAQIEDVPAEILRRGRAGYPAVQHLEPSPEIERLRPVVQQCLQEVGVDAIVLTDQCGIGGRAADRHDADDRLWSLEGPVLRPASPRVVAKLGVERTVRGSRSVQVVVVWDVNARDPQILGLQQLKVQVLLARIACQQRYEEPPAGHFDEAESDDQQRERHYAEDPEPPHPPHNGRPPAAWLRPV